MCDALPVSQNVNTEEPSPSMDRRVWTDVFVPHIENLDSRCPTLGGESTYEYSTLFVVVLLVTVTIGVVVISFK